MPVARLEWRDASGRLLTADDIAAFFALCGQARLLPDVEHLDQQLADERALSQALREVAQQALNDLHSERERRVAAQEELLRRAPTPSNTPQASEEPYFTPQASEEPYFTPQASEEPYFTRKGDLFAIPVSEAYPEERLRLTTNRQDGPNGFR